MTEELKVVMEAIQSLGADGKQAFILWLVFRLSQSLIFAALWLTGFVLIYRTMRRVVQQAGLTAAIKKVCGIYGDLNKSDIDRIMEIVRKGLLK